MRADYTVCVQDEAICMADARLRKGVYTPKGVRGVYTYTGSHSKTIVFGLITLDGGGVLPEIQLLYREGVCRVPEGRMRKVRKSPDDHRRRAAAQVEIRQGGRSGAWTAWSCSFCHPAARI